MMTADVCGECGAPSEDGESCAERVHELLAYDYTDQAYARVHHLLVVTYQVQHATGFTDAAVAEYDEALIRHARDVTADPYGGGVRRWLYGRVGQLSSGKHRVRSDEPVERSRPRWSRSVFDVDFSDAYAYCDSVSAWAAVTWNTRAERLSRVLYGQRMQTTEHPAGWATCFPQLGSTVDPSEATVIDDGWDYRVVRVAGTTAVRIPRRGDYLNLAATELAVLSELAPSLTVPIPVPQRSVPPTGRRAARGCPVGRSTGWPSRPSAPSGWPTSSPRPSRRSTGFRRPGAGPRG